MAHVCVKVWYRQQAEGTERGILLLTGIAGDQPTK